MAPAQRKSILKKKGGTKKKAGTTATTRKKRVTFAAGGGKSRRPKATLTTSQSLYFGDTGTMAPQSLVTNLLSSGSFSPQDSARMLAFASRYSRGDGQSVFDYAESMNNMARQANQPLPFPDLQNRLQMIKNFGMPYMGVSGGGGRNLWAASGGYQLGRNVNQLGNWGMLGPASRPLDLNVSRRLGFNEGIAAAVGNVGETPGGGAGGETPGGGGNEPTPDGFHQPFGGYGGGVPFWARSFLGKRGGMFANSGGYGRGGYPGNVQGMLIEEMAAAARESGNPQLANYLYGMGASSAASGMCQPARTKKGRFKKGGGCGGGGSSLRGSRMSGGVFGGGGSSVEAYNARLLDQFGQLDSVYRQPFGVVDKLGYMNQMRTVPGLDTDFTVDPNREYHVLGTRTPMNPNLAKAVTRALYQRMEQERMRPATAQSLDTVLVLHYHAKAAAYTAALNEAAANAREMKSVAAVLRMSRQMPGFAGGAHPALIDKARQAFVDRYLSGRRYGWEEVTTGSPEAGDAEVQRYYANQRDRDQADYKAHYAWAMVMPSLAQLTLGRKASSRMPINPLFTTDWSGSLENFSALMGTVGAGVDGARYKRAHLTRVIDDVSKRYSYGPEDLVLEYRAPIDGAGGGVPETDRQAIAIRNFDRLMSLRQANDRGEM